MNKASTAVIGLVAVSLGCTVQAAPKVDLSWADKPGVPEEYRAEVTANVATAMKVFLEGCALEHSTLEIVAANAKKKGWHEVTGGERQASGIPDAPNGPDVLWRFEVPASHDGGSNMEFQLSYKRSAAFDRCIVSFHRTWNSTLKQFLMTQLHRAPDHYDKEGGSTTIKQGQMFTAFWNGVNRDQTQVLSVSGPFLQDFNMDVNRYLISDTHDLAPKPNR